MQIVCDCGEKKVIHYVIWSVLHIWHSDVCNMEKSQVNSLLFNLSDDYISMLLMLKLLESLNFYVIFPSSLVFAWFPWWFFLRLQFLAYKFFNHKIKLSVKWYQNTKYKYRIYIIDQTHQAVSAIVAAAASSEVKEQQ